MVEETSDGCVEKEDGIVEKLASSDDSDEEECDDDTRPPLSAAVISDQRSHPPMGLQTTANGAKKTVAFTDMTWSQIRKDSPDLQSQIRKESPVVFLTVDREAGTYTGEQALAGDRRCTGEGATAGGATTGDWMCNDDGTNVGDNHVGNKGEGDFLFCSKNHFQKEGCKNHVQKEGKRVKF
ncbi:hypothetical protein L2E82_44813 [Cichorium intybus]|uniref:Uncharacterized protein n=1 Tax=Cichorium intybus TaxID=13427 RepID=A0ACB8ZQA1_CICIN|nr:hypothetical protein L2E82_44813 [Cichorium intybus]